MEEFESAIDANLTPAVSALWAQRVSGWSGLSLPARRCYLECILQDIVDDGPLSRQEVEQLDSRCRGYYFRLMLVWARGSGMATVRGAKHTARQVIIDELEERAAPRKMLYSWQNRYGGGG